MMKTDFICNTDGRGYWSPDIRAVRIYKLNLAYVDMENQTAELRAYFTAKTWNISKHGLIYTDDKWLREFKKNLKKLGFSDKTLREVDYSEQGMQGDNYVSMDVGKNFIKEWVKKS